MASHRIGAADTSNRQTPAAEPRSAPCMQLGDAYRLQREAGAVVYIHTRGHRDVGWGGDHDSCTAVATTMAVAASKTALHGNMHHVHFAVACRLTRRQPPQMPESEALQGMGIGHGCCLGWISAAAQCTPEGRSPLHAHGGGQD